jgi:hypothetical protein
VKAIDCVEITSEQVARSKVGAVLVFGALGGLAAKGSEDRGTLLVHLKSGQTGYLSNKGHSQHLLLAKLTPWLKSVNIPVRAPAMGHHAQPTQAVADPFSVADEIAKLGALKTQGLAKRSLPPKRPDS